MSESVLPIILTVGGMVLLFVVLTAVMLRMLFRLGAQGADQKLMAKLGNPEVLLRDDMANCFGVKSIGVVQLRGNGVLVLTRDVLAFQPWFRAEAIVIERARITAAKTSRSHLGKAIGRDLLAVEFTDPKQGDARDEVAWYVRTLPPWLAALRAS
jgi:hypothetical protein